LNILIGQILGAAKAEQLKPGSKKLFDLSRLVREVAEDADFEASGKDRRVMVENNELSLMHGDREMLRSAIENVVRNAIRYTPGRTDVHVNLQRVDGTHAQVTVRDHGPGVPEDALPHLFEPFFRVNDARDRDSGGAGLGLAITRHAISAHGGNVSASNRDGGGFEVQMSLPLTTPESVNRNGIKFRGA
jgi:signal transduction histidine kinase